MPARTCLNLRPPCTGTGLSRWVRLASPSWPYWLLPQQYATPADVTAQVWTDPALSCVKVSVVETATGALRSAVVPSPNCPVLKFLPQQKARPDRLRAQLWLAPDWMSCQRPPLAT